MQSIHRSPAAAVFSDHRRATDALPPAAIGRDAARQLLESGLPGPAPRQSLAHVDLSRRLRLAAVTRPRWEGDPPGHTRLNAGLP